MTEINENNIVGIDDTGILKWMINDDGFYIADTSEWSNEIVPTNDSKVRCEYCGSWKDMYDGCDKCGAP